MKWFKFSKFLVFNSSGRRFVELDLLIRMHSVKSCANELNAVLRTFKDRLAPGNFLLAPASLASSTTPSYRTFHSEIINNILFH